MDVFDYLKNEEEFIGVNVNDDFVKMIIYISIIFNFGIEVV